MTKKLSSLPSTRTKICIVGAYPEHCYKAPFDDLSWEIWAMSAGRYNKYPRWDKWFELHPERNYPRYEAKSPGYMDFVRREAITYDLFPFETLLYRFGPYFFTTGQITWLLAYAINQSPVVETIGIWGVEAVGEYSPQRKDIHHFVQVAHDRGIKVVVPDGCTLLDTPNLYAFSQA